MPLPQFSLNPVCTYHDVLLYILLFPCFRVARILKRFITSHENEDAPVSAVLCLPACLCVSATASRGQARHGNVSISPILYSFSRMTQVLFQPAQGRIPRNIHIGSRSG